MALDRYTADFLRFLDYEHVPAPERLGVSAARDAMRQDVRLDERRALDVDDIGIPSEGGRIGVRVIWPARLSGAELPCVVYLHGGGWVLGDEVTHANVVQRIARDADVAVIFIKYSRAPEARFPVALTEISSVLHWLVDHASSWRLDASRIALVGDSAGGNLAAAAALMVAEGGGPPIRFLGLAFPALDADFETSSYREFASGHFLTRETMKWFWDQYVPDPVARRQPLVSPLHASLPALRRLPPTFIATAENDPLRDDGEAFAARLMQAGVDVVATRYLGTIHACVVLPALADTPAANAIVEQLCAQIALHLHA
jgi:acetyl esterase